MNVLIFSLPLGMQKCVVVSIEMCTCPSTNVSVYIRDGISVYRYIGYADISALFEISLSVSVKVRTDKMLPA